MTERVERTGRLGNGTASLVGSPAGSPGSSAAGTSDASELDAGTAGSGGSAVGSLDNNAASAEPGGLGTGTTSPAVSTDSRADPADPGRPGIGSAAPAGSLASSQGGTAVSADPGGLDTRREADPGGLRRVETLAPSALPGRAAELLTDGYRLALVACHDDSGAPASDVVPASGAVPAPGGVLAAGSTPASSEPRLRLVYLFTAARPDRRVELRVPLEPGEVHAPSLASLTFPAGRFEMEAADLFGFIADGHPLPRRLVRHAHWPRGWFPMRAHPGPETGEPEGPFTFRAVGGTGVYEIPVGPVHAGMIGPAHFRFSVVGETILSLQARLGYVHRGLEKLAEGREVTAALELAERVSGDTTVGHALAYSRAVEDAAGIEVSPEADRLRQLVLELERVYNHVADLGALCNDVGHGILNVHAGRLREQLLRINDAVAGHRLLRGVVRPGGAEVRELPDPVRLRDIADEAAELVELALGHSVVADRFAGTAVLRPEQAADLGVLGYVAKASGLIVDARRDHPTSGRTWPAADYRNTDGDVLARFLVRADEIAESVGALIGLIAELDGLHSAFGELPALGAGSGVGIAEGWRGTIVHRLETGDDGRLRRLKIVDPSFLNWPALSVALADTIVPDFPLTNKSFNLSYAGNDL